MGVPTRWRHFELAGECQNTPIGETWTLTHVDGNLIHKNREPTAYEVLAETFNQLSLTEQKHVPGQFIHRAGDQRIPRGFFIAGIFW